MIMTHFQKCHMVQINRTIFRIELNFIDLEFKSTLEMSRPILIHFIKLLIQKPPIVPYTQFCNKKYLTVCPFIKKHEHIHVPLLDLDVWKNIYSLQIKPKPVLTTCTQMHSDIMSDTHEMQSSGESSGALSKLLDNTDLDIAALTASQTPPNSCDVTREPKKVNTQEHFNKNLSLAEQSQERHNSNKQPVAELEDSHEAPCLNFISENSQNIVVAPNILHQETVNCDKTTFENHLNNSSENIVITIEKSKTGEPIIATSPKERPYHYSTLKFDQEESSRLEPAIISPDCSSQSESSYCTPPESTFDVPMSQDTQELYDDLFTMNEHEQNMAKSLFRDAKENKRKISTHLFRNVDEDYGVQKRTPSKRKGLPRSGNQV